MRPRLGILISGRGSNMASIVRAARSGRIPAEPAVVISNRPGAPGLERARRLGVEARVVESAGFAGPRAAYDRLVMRELARAGVGPRSGIVCLAGYMRIVGPEFVARYRNRVLNVHPSLLPAFPGLDAQGQAVRYGARVSGCTVHLVDAGVDTGPVLLQAAVPVLPGDTAESLARRIISRERRLYPEAVALVASGRVRVRGRRAAVS